jgi:hypothetical protein
MLVPATVKLSDADGTPWMVVSAARLLAVSITGVGVDVGSIVMVNVLAEPSQPVPPLIKLPNDRGWVPTVTLATTAFVAVLINEILFAPVLTTQTNAPSAVTDTA